jgi:cell division transport system ATP-binding protein
MIQMFHASKAYPGDPPAVQDITLHVGKGEFVFLTGPSGAGKTTLLKMLFCAERATSGQILVGGRNISRIQESSVPLLRRNIGVVFQDFKLLKERTVQDNVGFPLEVLGTPAREMRRRALGMLERVGLADKAETFPQKLSGGEQQRVAIARALINDPMLLLADEPTGNLDAKLTIEIMELLAQANARGTTVMVATHDQTLLERYRRRVIALEKGQLVADSAP